MKNYYDILGIKKRTNRESGTESLRSFYESGRM